MGKGTVNGSLFFHTHMYSVGNLVLPQQNFYLVSGIGPNLGAPTSGVRQWNLTSSVSIDMSGMRSVALGWLLK